MSTRGNIIFLETERDFNINETVLNLDKITSEPIIYIHSDMYPSGCLNWLNEFLKLPATLNRKNDINYLMSWCITYYNINVMAYYLDRNSKDINDFDSLLDYLTYETNYIFKNDFQNLKDFRGSGLYNFVAGDSEYVYIITPCHDKNLTHNFNIYVFNYEWDSDCFKCIGLFNEYTSFNEFENL